MATNDLNNILNIDAHVAQDNSIIKKEFLTYTPYTNSLGENDEIRIAIQNQDTYHLNHISTCKF